MLTSVRGLTAASVFALSTAFAVPALAQDEDEGIGVSVSANVALVTDYRFRGIDLSGGDIAVQGGVDVGLPAGFYVGTWASSIDGGTYGHTELDVYGGWAGEFGNVTTDVGVIMYIYPNAVAGDFDYVEFYGSVGVGLGPASVEVGIAYAPDQDSLGSTDNFYIYTDVGVGIPDTPVTITGHIGYTDGFLTYTTDGEALDWSLGAETGIPGTPLSVGIAYIGVEGDGLIDPGGVFTDDAVVGTLSASF